MGGQAELTGPDLGAGVDADRLRSGDKLLGHAQGEPVLLARLGDDFVAIGASCTHYGGPLAEGVIDGDHVRCPWHHACFSLRTGEALRAPALNPVACWKTERRGTTVVVTEKIERDPLASTYPAAAGGAGSAPRNIVIVGAGAAGSAAMEMLRRCGYAGRITVVDPDTAAPYDRPNLSKDYLAGNAPEEWIPIRPEGFYAQHRVDLVRGRVARIDVATRTVHVDGGNSLNYDALLLAPGAEPVHLETPGDDQPHVHYLRSLADSRSIIEAAKKAKTAVVIGSSFIGLEVAAALRTRNVVVHVVAPEQVPLARVLGEQLGGFIRQLHEEHGVVFHLQHTARSIEPHAVILDNGDRIQADLVVIGVGVKPRLELAEKAGLAVDRGVTVNEQLQTSIPGIFAA
ncbi:MAG TPA: FAD-dependent oxidoreductase, partial [Gemmatimonadaceae bacterium]